MKHILILLSLIILFYSCNQSASGKKNEAKEAAKEKFSFSKIMKGSLSTSLALPGQLQPFEIVQLFPKVNGFVKNVLVDRGTVVKTGQVLLQLEAPEIQEQYLAAKAKTQQAISMYYASKDNFERLLSTSKTPGTVSPHDLEMARSKMMADSAVAEAERSTSNSLKATLDYLVVKAPFDGVITERNVHPGALVGPNIKTDDKPMLVLQQEAKLRLVIEVPEVYTSQLAGKSTFSFSVNSLPGKTFQGTLSRASGALSTKYRSETAEIDVLNQQHLLKPGMYAQVLLPLSGNAEALIVPHSSIVTSTERKYVIVVKDGKTRWIDIAEGNSRNDSTEIFGNLNEGEIVLSKATDEIREGIDVK
jgi:RND family efflux transporter MFP subunit